MCSSLPNSRGCTCNNNNLIFHSNFFHQCDYCLVLYFVFKFNRSMSIQEVRDAKTEKEFLRLPFKIYRKDSNWIPHLKQDIQAVFDPKKNKFFRHGEAIRWILNKNGETIGRMAAFINHNPIKKINVLKVGMDFLKSLN